MPAALDRIYRMNRIFSWVEWSLRSNGECRIVNEPRLILLFLTAKYAKLRERRLGMILHF